MSTTTYRVTENSDGSVRVESHGPASRMWRAFRVVVAALFLIGAAVCLFTGQWGAFVVDLLIGAIVLPTMRG